MSEQPSEPSETIEHDGQTLYAPILACRPVRPADYPPEFQEMYRRLQSQINADLTIYPDSAITTCEECGIEIGVGPRQQAAAQVAKELGLAAHTLCLVHAATRADPDDTQIVSLGNPFKG